MLEWQSFYDGVDIALKEGPSEDLPGRNAVAPYSPYIKVCVTRRSHIGVGSDF